MAWLAAFSLSFTAFAADLPGGNVPAGINGVAGLEKLAKPDEIISEFTAGKSDVRVLVKLAEPQEKQRVDWEKKETIAALHAAVRAVQQRVIAQHGVADLKVRRTYQNHAGFSAEVSWNGLQALLKHPEVVSVELVHLNKPHLAQGIPLMNAMGYRSTYNGAGISIAICDTGVDYRHPRLGGGGFPNSKVIGGFDFGDDDPNPAPSDEAHGTACAGIAAGDLGTVGDYIGGVAPAAKIYALKITPDAFPGAMDDDIAAAWDWCVTHRNDDTNNPIKIISTSFGGGRFFTACDSSQSILAAAADSAVSAGITMFVSSGNDGYCDSISSPACLSGVIAVGAVYDANIGLAYPCLSAGSCVNSFFDPFGCFSGYYAIDTTAPDKVTSYSNTSSLLGVLAPSSRTYTLDIVGAGGYSPGDYETDFGGTSAACPYVAGAAAALQSAAKARLGRFLTPAEMRTKLASTGDNIADTKVDITKPRINLGRAIDSMISTQLFTITATLASESCVATNRAVDPGEIVVINASLRNVGTVNASNVTVSLVPTADVLSPSQAQTYGALVAGGAAVSKTFTFTAGGRCGGTITNTFLILSGGTNIGRVTVAWPLGVVTTRLGQNFDSVKWPNLPANWVGSPTGDTGWTTTTNRYSTPSNSIFVANSASAADATLTSPLFLVSSPGAELSFSHSYDTEYGFDGGVLEIAINNGPFTDIIAAGGVFRDNGYTFNIDSSFGSALAGRDAWTGQSSNFVNTVVTLPPSAAGQNVRLRWRFASDANVGGTGWNIDSIIVTDRSCCGGTTPVILYPQRQGNSLVFSYNSFPGQTYYIEYKDSWSAPSWTVMRTDTGDNSLKSLTNNLSATQRFYRIRQR